MDALPEDFQQSLDKFKVPAEEQAELTAGCGRKSDIQQTAVPLPGDRCTAAAVILQADKADDQPGMVGQDATASKDRATGLGSRRARSTPSPQGLPHSDLCETDQTLRPVKY